MDGLLDFFSVDFLHHHLPDSWFDSFHKAWGDSLSDEMVLQSVQEASDFFNMNAPMDVHEDWTTGVMTGMDFTEDDDILVFNRQQMLDMGITDKEGFDLVMTHEGAHRMLQGMHDITGFDSHQEELCCDYMAGVRAGLKDMDFTKMEASLAGSAESETHPGGATRVEAIEAGVDCAHEFMNKYHRAPTFSECLDHFEHSDVYAQARGRVDVNLSPETHHAFAEPDAMEKAKNEHHLAELAAERGDFADMREHKRLENFYLQQGNESATENSESTLKAYSKDEINRKLAHAESEKRRYEGLVEHHKYMAKHGLSKADTEYHLKEARIFQTRANECAAEANKWRYTKPDK